jgi:hypothetical protein
LHSAARQAPVGAQTLGVPTHSPPLQAVFSTHLSPREQASPFILLALAQGAPTGPEASQRPTRQSLSSEVQSFGEIEQAPVVQVPTAALQPLPPQVVPLGTLLSSQLPVVVLHTGWVWHSRLTQTTLLAVSATQLPLMHLSFGVQASLSALQAAPSL